MRAANIAKLKAQRCWLVHNASKQPFYCTNGEPRTGTNGSDADRAELVNFAEAQRILAKNPELFSGVGIALLPELNITIVDFDKATDDAGNPKERTKELLALCNGAYVEWSPSGHGMHAIFADHSTLPDNRNIGDGIGVDIFTSKKFVTWTGRPLKETSDATFAPIPAALDAALRKTSDVQRPKTTPAKQRKFNPNSTHEVEELSSALQALDADNRDVWLKVLLASGHAFEQSREGFLIVDQWARKSEKYSHKETHRIYYKDSLKRADGEDVVTVATIFGWARDAGWKPDAGQRANLIQVEDVQAEKVFWLWSNRFALGKLSLLIGDPDLGKSHVTLDIAATVSNGGRFVDHAYAEAGSVIILSAEDDIADTIRPRLEAARANLKRIHVLQTVQDGFDNDGKPRLRPFNLAIDIPRLREACAELGDVALIIIDPISAYMGATDSHVNAAVRGLLMPLSAVAAELHVAVLAVTHLNKSTDNNKALSRAMGSIAFGAAARAAWLICKDQTDATGSRRLMLSVKGNLAPDGRKTGLAYTIEGAEVGYSGGTLRTSRVKWIPGEVEQTADAALAAANEKPEHSGELDRAKAALLDALSAGPRPAKDVYEALGDDGQGFAKRTIIRARIELGVVATKGTGKGAGWTWTAPPEGKF